VTLGEALSLITRSVSTRGREFLTALAEALEGGDGVTWRPPYALAP
jgi:hypothetical protein